MLFLSWNPQLRSFTLKVTCYTHCRRYWWNALPTSELSSHSLFSIHQISTKVNRWFFPICRNSLEYLAHGSQTIFSYTFIKKNSMPSGCRFSSTFTAAFIFIISELFQHLVKMSWVVCRYLAAMLKYVWSLPYNLIHKDKRGIHAFLKDISARIWTWNTDSTFCTNNPWTTLHVCHTASFKRITKMVDD